MGSFFPPGDAEILADHHLYFLSQPELIEGLGRMRIQTSYSLDQMLKKIEDPMLALLRQKGI